ncbi:T9SS type A sorting domain-containing protein [Flavobacterium sp. SM15]|nr:T9SS type A sorting domain-containing protein [Flavobacterium sp. SM15]
MVTTTAEDWLVTPLVNLTDYTNVSLSFWGGQQYTADYATEYTVRVSTTSQTDISSFTTIETYTEADFATTTPISSQKTVDLSAYNGQQIYIAFVMSQNDGDNWFIDDVNVTGTLGTADFNNNSAAAVYPNPTKGLITITNEENIQSIEVYGILGNLIKTVSRTNKVDIGELANGSYLIKIKTDQGAVRTEKVIKN